MATKKAAAKTSSYTFKGGYPATKTVRLARPVS